MVQKDKSAEQQDVAYWESVWDKTATIEDLLKMVVSAPRAAYIKDAFPQHGVVVDAGCGNAKWDFYLTTQGYRVIGVDYAVQTLARNMAISDETPYACDFLGSDIGALPLKNNSVDGYFSIGVWEHFLRPEQENFAAEAFRTLRPGGIILVNVPNRYSPWTVTLNTRYYLRRMRKEYVVWQRNMSRKEVTTICEKAGFQTLQCVNFNVAASLRLSLYLDIPRVRKHIPNPFYLVRNPVKTLAKSLEKKLPVLGYDTLYIGRKV